MCTNNIQRLGYLLREIAFTVLFYQFLELILGADAIMSLNPLCMMLIGKPVTLPKLFVTVIEEEEMIPGELPSEIASLAVVDGGIPSRIALTPCGWLFLVVFPGRLVLEYFLLGDIQKTVSVGMQTDLEVPKDILSHETQTEERVHQQDRINMEKVTCSVGTQTEMDAPRSTMIETEVPLELTNRTKKTDLGARSPYYICIQETAVNDGVGEATSFTDYSSLQIVREADKESQYRSQVPLTGDETGRIMDIFKMKRFLLRLVPDASELVLQIGRLSETGANHGAFVVPWSLFPTETAASAADLREVIFLSLKFVAETDFATEPLGTIHMESIIHKFEPLIRELLQGLAQLRIVKTSAIMGEIDRLTGVNGHLSLACNSETAVTRL